MEDYSGALEEKELLRVCQKCHKDIKDGPIPKDWRDEVKVWHLVIGIPTLLAVQTVLSVFLR
jgi:hypothetical protein